MSGENHEVDGKLFASKRQIVLVQMRINVSKICSFHSKIRGVTWKGLSLLRLYIRVNPLLYGGTRDCANQKDTLLPHYLLFLYLCKVVGVALKHAE